MSEVLVSNVNQFYNISISFNFKYIGVYIYLDPPGTGL